MKTDGLVETRLIQNLRYKTKGDDTCMVGEVFAFGQESRESTPECQFLKKIKDLICFAYMESSEYHTGIVPESLMYIQENYNDYLFWKNETLPFANPAFVIGKKKDVELINIRIKEYMAFNQHYIEQGSGFVNPLLGYFELDNRFLVIFNEAIANNLNALFSYSSTQRQIEFSN